MWINKNSRKLIISGILIIAIIFILPYIWPVDTEWYFRNLSWMIPLAVVLFIAPVVPFILSSWDIHFYFDSEGGKLIIIITNHGANPYNFNRIQFASGKKCLIMGKRRLYPKDGITDSYVEYHGADTPSHELHPHIGYTLQKGLPITLTIRNFNIPECLRNFKNNQNIYISLYYEGSNQRVYSKQIPNEVINEFIQSRYLMK